MKAVEQEFEERKFEYRAKFDKLNDQIMIMENYVENYIPVQVETMIIENMRLILTEE